MSFEKVYQWSKLLAILSVVPVMIVLAMFLWQVKGTTNQLLWTVNETVATLPHNVDDRIGKVQTDLMTKIDTVQDKTNTEITKLATLTGSKVDTLNTTANNLIAAVNTQLGTANTNINTQLTAANTSIGTLTTAYASIPQVIGDRYNRDFDSYFNCSKNMLCLQGQASDTMFAIRTASRDTSTTMAGIATSLPTIEGNITKISDTVALDFPKITSNFASITTNINTLTKPHWYDRLLGYALNGVVIYRSLNPATAVPTAAIQFVSSQK